MSPDVVALIGAKVTERRALAKAVANRRWQVNLSWAGNNAVLDDEGHPLAVCGDNYPPDYTDASDCAAHIAANDPVAILLLCDHADKVLARHGNRSGECECCSDDRGPLLWPCPDVRDLAAAWGVTDD